MREDILNDRESTDLALFEKIKTNPQPDILDLWALSEKRFRAWRRIHDFPKLLAHFDKTLIMFKEWKEAQKLNNEIIINSDEISPFLEKKKLAKRNKKLYLIQIQKEGNAEVQTHVTYGKIDEKKTYDNKVYEYKTILEFTPYLDWLAKKGQTQEILNINIRTAPETNMERVYIHADINATNKEYELLKMGGINIPVDGLGALYRGKRLEFVNLCGLKLTGDIYFSDLGNLSCSYCACDNWVAEKFEMPTPDFEHCTISNFNVRDSILQQWRFYDCIVSGDFINTKLASIEIYGGNFSPLLLDSPIYDVEIKTDKAIKDNNGYAYKTFKRIYANQGDDDKAKEYFLKENEYIRKKSKWLNYLTKTLSYYYWQYGRKPHRIIYLSLAIIISFAFIYWLNNDLIALNSTEVKYFGLKESLYFSTTTFTTLGYGDLSPLGWLRILTSIEAFLGVINMGFLIAGYSNNKY